MMWEPRTKWLWNFMFHKRWGIYWPIWTLLTSQKNSLYGICLLAILNSVFNHNYRKLGSQHLNLPPQCTLVFSLCLGINMEGWWRVEDCLQKIKKNRSFSVFEVQILQVVLLEKLKSQKWVILAVTIIYYFIYISLNIRIEINSWIMYHFWMTRTGGLLLSFAH
jgi:hypothetical protein